MNLWFERSTFPQANKHTFTTVSSESFHHIDFQTHEPGRKTFMVRAILNTILYFPYADNNEFIQVLFNTVIIMKFNNWFVYNFQLQITGSNLNGIFSNNFSVIFLVFCLKEFVLCWCDNLMPFIKYRYLLLQWHSIDFHYIDSSFWFEWETIVRVISRWEPVCFKSFAQCTHCVLLVPVFQNHQIRRYIYRFHLMFWLKLKKKKIFFSRSQYEK